MNCFVHLDFDPIPREVKSPASAIALAEAVLKVEKEEDPDSKLKILWRRDDYYPDNFFEYTIEQLQKELQEKGTVVLQLVRTDGDLPILCESVTIFTETLEKKYVDEADSALEDADDEMEQKHLDIHGESLLKRRARTKKI